MISLRAYRKNYNLTQVQLAKMLGVSSSTVTQWELGDRKPNIIMLKKLSIILNCTTDDLLKPIEVNVLGGNNYA